MPLISIKLYISAVRCLNALSLKEVLAILWNPSHATVTVNVFLTVYYSCFIVWLAQLACSTESVLYLLQVGEL